MPSSPKEYISPIGVIRKGGKCSSAGSSTGGAWNAEVQSAELLT